MTLSNSINEEFKGYLLNTGKSLEGVDLTVRVLTTGCWPGHNQTLNITVPRIPAAAFDVFKSFFLGMKIVNKQLITAKFYFNFILQPNTPEES